MTVSAEEFLRRFLVHVLPKALVRIRHFGLFANRRRGSMLARCCALLGAHDCATYAEIIAQMRCPLLWSDARSRTDDQQPALLSLRLVIAQSTAERG
jgi:hypothetical protein